MKTTSHRLLSLLVAIAMLLGSYFTVQAERASQTDNNVYVSTTGSGTTCTQTAPCSMSTGAKNLAAGKTLVFQPGTYNSTLQITKSGNASQPIKVQGPATIQAVIISGSYIEVSGLEVAGATTHGVAINGKHIKFSNFSVHDNVNENKSGSACSGSGSWGSGLKIAVGGEDIQISDGQIFHNCGEGFAVTRGINVTVTNVVSYDNFSANFYLDNSKQVTLQRSFAYCTSNTNYYRSGQPATGILIGEEYYSGWGGQLGSLTIVNNISYGCKGLNFYGVESGVPNGGIAGALIAHNTIWNVYGSGKAISISDQPANQNIIIGNNIAAGAIAPDNGTLLNNQSNAVFASTPTYSMASFLPAQNSPGINAGAALGITTDINGSVRDALPDVGAWETGSVQPTATKTSATATKTAVPLTATKTSVPATTTKTSVSPTATKTAVPVTVTKTATANPTRPAVTSTAQPKGQYSLDVRIASGGDDAEESTSGNVTLDSSDLELIYDGSRQTVGLRFNGVAIPRGAKIANAFVQFKVDETSSGKLSLYIQGEASAHAAMFSANAQNISSRPKTMNSVIWEPSNWTTVGATGTSQATPNLSAIIQEIINQPDWVSGNALALIISGINNKRVAESFEGDAAGAPMLHIEYSLGSSMLDEAATPTPTAVSSPTATATDIPTEAPSSTPAPTETPLPSETPTPTETPTLTETPSQEIMPPSEPPTTPAP